MNEHQKLACRQTKIFGIGLSRTGTKSLHHTFEMLGLESQHFLGPAVSEDLWEKISELDCASDTPIPSIYRLLDTKYPEAKFILTVRPLEEWLGSMEWMFKHGKVLWNYGNRIDDYHRSFYGTHKFHTRTLTDFYHKFHEGVFEYFDGDERFLSIETSNLTPPLVADFLKLDVDHKLSVRKNARRKAKLVARLKYRINRFANRIP